MKKLTVGMAHFADFDGVYFSIQAARLGNELNDIDFIVVDNDPNGPESDAIKNLMGNVGGKYIPCPTVGTSFPRDLIFKEAETPYVLCQDCHVLTPPGVLDRLICWYDGHHDTNDLLTGPLIYDNFTGFSTHFDRQWRAEMLGTWGSAWSCNCKNKFSVQDNNGICEFHELLTFDVIEGCNCGKFPILNFIGHEQNLKNLGYKMLAEDPDDEEFEIPAHGLGLFTCRKEAWLGFNINFRGFGGEEFYIHEKYRQNGRKTLCLPFLQWVHRFARPRGVKYPLTRWNKVRNYVIGHRELGLPLDAIKEHFINSKFISESDWDYLLENPEKHTTSKGCGGCKSAIYDKSIEEIFETYWKTPVGLSADIHQHLPKLKQLASQVNSVTELGCRSGTSTIGFLSGKPKKMVSYNSTKDSNVSILKQKAKDTDFNFIIGDSLSVEIEPTDLLFIDTKHVGDQLIKELRKHHERVKRFIVLHDTQVYGEFGEGHSENNPTAGLLPAMRLFMIENPKWSVIYHSPDNNGLTVLSCNDDDKPKLPNVFKLAANFARAVKNHISDGAKNTIPDCLNKRLGICTLCEARRGDRCSVCGCFIINGTGGLGKASWAEQQCPLGKWEC